jgi:hypothetical protein
MVAMVRFYSLSAPPTATAKVRETQKSATLYKIYNKVLKEPIVGLVEFNQINRLEILAYGLYYERRFKV